MRERTFTYDHVGNETGETRFASGGTIVTDKLTFTYDADNNQLSAEHRATSISYDGAKTTIAYDTVSTITYDALDRVSTVSATTDSVLVTQTFGYDDDDRRTLVDDSKGGVETSTYDAIGELIRRIQSGGVSGDTQRVDYYYDAAGRQTLMARYSFAPTTAGPQMLGVLVNGDSTNLMGPLPAEAYQRSEVTTLRLVFDQPISTIDTGALAIAVHSGSSGTVPTLSTPSTSDYGYTWDVSFSGSGVNVATGSIANGVYDVSVDHTKVHGESLDMADDVTFTFGRLQGDLTGNLTVDGKDSAIFITSYLRSSTDPLFIPAADYDGDHVITASDLLSMPFTSLAFNPSNSIGVAWTVSIYDADGEVTENKTGNAAGSTISKEDYTYDGAGRISVQTTLDGITSTFTYDNLGEIKTEQINGALTTFSYDDAGNRSAVVTAAGTSTYTSDGTSGSFSQQDNRLTSDGTWNYSYDDVGNRTEKDSVSTSDKWLYFYDTNNELIEVEELFDGSHVNLRVEYEYDAWGDRVATTTDIDGDGYIRAGDQWASAALGASYGYPGTGSYSAAQAVGTPNVTSYGYSPKAWFDYPNTSPGYLLLGFATPVHADGVNVVESHNNGHVTEVDLVYTDNTTSAISVTDTTTHGLATLHVSFSTTPKFVKQVKIVVNDVGSGSYSQIDAVELLTPDTVLAETDIGFTDQSPATTYYVLDGWDPMKPAGVGTENVDVRMDLDGSGSLTARYLRNDQVDQMVGRVDYTGGGTTASAKWYVLDRQDSIADVLDGRGQVLDALTYDAYGNILTETDPSQRGRYAWTGRELDAETGLQYNRARWYDPTVGQWISQDPMGFAAGDSNLYRYVTNAPTDYGDPSGNDPLIFKIFGIAKQAFDGDLAKQAKIAYDKYQEYSKQVQDGADYLFSNPAASQLRDEIEKKIGKIRIVVGPDDLNGGHWQGGKVREITIDPRHKLTCTKEGIAFVILFELHNASHENQFQAVNVDAPKLSMLDYMIDNEAIEFGSRKKTILMIQTAPLGTWPDMPAFTDLTFNEYLMAEINNRQGKHLRYYCDEWNESYLDEWISKGKDPNTISPRNQLRLKPETMKALQGLYPAK